MASRPAALTAAEPAVPEPRASRLTEMSCRLLDVLVASLLLVVLAPVLLLVALAIRIDSAGSPLFRQRRHGLRGRPFTINKFRTMTTGAADDEHRTFVLSLIAGDGTVERTAEGPLYKLAVDTRITRFGRFLRRFSVDELPQLWNVVCGDMSLVGPRPPLSYEVEHYPADWFARFEVKPGLTGLWQVSGRSTLTLEEMIALDNEYVRRRSLWFNLWILVRTIPVVFQARGAA